jgi:phosphonate transport system substrate-binding protein
MVSRTLAVAAAVALAVVACSDTGDDAGGPGTTEVPTSSTWPESLIIGFVPEPGQEGLEEDIQPLVDELERALGVDVEGVVTNDQVGLYTALGTDNADLGVLGPFEYVIGGDQFGNIEALLQSTRSGSATHHGQWFTSDPELCRQAPVPGTALENQAGRVVQVDAADIPGSSCIGDLRRVEGKRIAFTTETSPTGYLLPALQLANLGLDADDDVDPTFAGDHASALAAVEAGEADVGLSISGEQPDVGEELIVFAITPEIPHDTLAVRSDLPASLKEAVHDAVVDYLQTEEGTEVFEQVYGWTEVRRARESDFDIVREAVEALELSEPPA